MENNTIITAAAENTENTKNTAAENHEGMVQCAHCGRWVDEATVTDVDGEDWCTECVHEDAHWCEHCERWTQDVFDVDGEFWCEECCDNDAHWCERCEEYHTDGEDVIVHQSWRGTEYQWWCSDCVENYSVVCEHCGERFSEDAPCIDEREMWDGTYQHICDRCISNEFYWCVDCERYVHSSDVEFVDGEPYCPDCADEHRHGDNLHDYGHTSGMVFWGDDLKPMAKSNMTSRAKKALYLGLELETDYNDNAYALADDIAAKYNGDYLCCKRDGSLNSNGVEIVSQPMTPNAHLTMGMWENVVDIVREHGGKSHEAGTCGLHIHLSRWFFKSHDAVYRLDRLFNRFRTQMINFSRRTGGGDMHWCRIDSYDELANVEEVWERKELWRRKKNGVNRYEAVNDTNTNTVEIRLWRGTLNKETIRATIEFTAGLAIMCNNMTDELADKLDWESLKTLVRYTLEANDISHTELDNYLNTRSL